MNKKRRRTQSKSLIQLEQTPQSGSNQPTTLAGIEAKLTSLEDKLKNLVNDKHKEQSESEHQKIEDQIKEMHDKAKEELRKRILYNTEQFDKMILAISSASLGLALSSIRFLKDFETEKFQWMMEWGCYGLALTVLLSLLAFQISNKALDQRFGILEKYYVGRDQKMLNKKTFFSEFNNYLNKLVGIILLVSISLIMQFFLNLFPEKGNVLANPTKSETTHGHGNGSAPMPPMEPINQSPPKVPTENKKDSK